MAAVLIPEADRILVGKDIVSVVLKLRAGYEIPSELCAFEEGVLLSSLDVEDICSRVKTLTGQSARDLLTLAGKTVDIDSLRMLAHFLIIRANHEYRSGHRGETAGDESEESI